MESDDGNFTYRCATQAAWSAANRPHKSLTAEAAKSADPKKVADMMHSGMNFKTVLGDIAYDKKGDITKLDYVMYIWKKDPSGKITYVECPASGCAM